MKNKSVDYYFSGILLEYRFFFFYWNIRRINCFDVFCEWNKFVDKKKDYLYPFFK